MPKCRDAKLLQVLVRQGRQNRFVNLVFAERSLILSKAKAPQPNAPKYRVSRIMVRR
jgi:hypothetical protein